MDSTTIQNIGIIFSLILGSVSLLLGAYQARICALQMKSTASGTMFGYLMQLNQLCLEHSDLEFEKLAGCEFGAIDAKDRKAQVLIDLHLTFVEEVFYQTHRFGNYSKEHWETWEKILIGIGRSDYVQTYWKVMRPNFDPEFAKSVDLAFSKSVILRSTK